MHTEKEKKWIQKEPSVYNETTVNPYKLTIRENVINILLEENKASISLCISGCKFLLARGLS